MNKPKLIFLILCLVLLSPLNSDAQTLNWIVAGDNGGYVHSLSYNPPNSPVELWKRQISSSGICALKIADLDNDGTKEIVVFSYDGNVYCLRGETGNEMWRYSSPYADFEKYCGIYIEDIDEDLRLEIIASIKVDSPGNVYYTGAGGGVIVLEDDGTEKMRYNSPIVNGWNGNGPDGTAMADFNGDGKKDYVFMIGGCLYSGAQPLIQVIDLSASFPALLRDFRYTYTSSGMNDLKVADVNNDGHVDFMAGGWWCPAAAFDSYGSLIWERTFSGGNADRYLIFVDDLDGSGQPALLVGTASYSYEAAMYIYVVDPSDGTDLYSAITHPTSARQLIPLADKVADIDGDGNNEILGWLQSADLSSDLLISASASDGSVEWAKQGVWNRYSAQLIDADNNGICEVYIGESNLLTCLQGNGQTLWQYDLGNSCNNFDFNSRITQTCELTIAAGTGGTTDPAPGSYTHNTGTQVTVTAVANTGYRFSGWSGAVTGTTNPITITMDADKSITANFIRQYTLTIFSGAGGTTNPVPGSYTHDTGTQVTITAVPNTGYRFSGWSGAVTGTTNTITVTMDTDKFIAANFIRQYTLTIAAENGGTTDPSPGTYTHDSGTEISVTAKPDNGYEFNGWSGDASGTNNPIKVTMDSDKSITANFKQKPFWERCFIATAAYGSPMHPHVKILRDFRDRYLMPTKLGRALVGLYYKYSPSIADLISKHKALRFFIRINLLPFVVFSYSMVHFGTVITVLLLVFISLFPVFFIKIRRKRIKSV